MARRVSKSKPRKKAQEKRAEAARPHLMDLSHWDTLAPPPIWLRIALPILVAVCTFVTFLPALDAEFTNWDDDKVIVDNPHIRGLTSEHVKWMFTEYKMGHYHPLTWVSYGIDHAIGKHRFPHLDKKSQKRYVRGLDPKIVHLTNLLLHVATVVAFYFLARLIFKLSMPTRTDGIDWASPLAAAIAAIFFGCHPLRVENAVWVTERRDVLSAMFLVPCLYFYLRYVLVEKWGGKKTALYAASLLLLALSLLSKAWGITLPAVLLVLDVYPLKRIGGQARWTGKRAVTVFVEKIPFFALALTFALFARAAQANQRHTMKTLAEWGVADRIAQVFYGLFWYSYKTLVPINLTPLVPLPPDNNPLAPRYVFAAIVVILVVVMLIRFRKKVPGLVVLAVCYAGVLSPILGIAQSGPQLVADKYAYLGCIPWAILVGAGWLWMVRRRNDSPRAKSTASASCAFTLVVLCTFAVLTWKQSEYWKDSYALWSHAVKIEPACVIAQQNLGLLERRRGNVDTAIEHYKVALQLDAKNASILTNLSLALREKLPDNPQPSDFNALIELHGKAIAIQPRMPDLYFAMGNTLIDAGRLEEALAALRKCLRLRTSSGQIAHPKYHRALGKLHMRLRQWDEASAQFESALKLETNMNPNGSGVINALDRLGRIREAQGRRKEAAAYFRRLLEIDPTNGPATRWLTSRGETLD